MIRQIEEVVITRRDENNEVVGTNTIQTVILIPEEGESLRNKITGDIINGVVGVGTSDSEDNYEAVPKEENI